MNELDAQLRSRQKSGLGWLIAGGIGSAVLLIGFVLWLFVVKGHIITVQPADAAKSAGFLVKDGNAMMIGNSVYRLGGEATVEVFAEEFVAQDVDVSNSSPSNIIITLSPKPGQVTGFISNVPDASVSWFLDNEPLYRGNPLDALITPGDHELTISHPFFEQEKLPLAIKRADNQSFELKLKPVSGRATIGSIPENANIVINGQQAGETPLEINLDGGQYDIEIRAAGYETVREQWTIGQQQRTLSRNYQLIPEQALLSISVSPENGNLLLNGVSAQPGTISIDANKETVIRYDKPGYTTFKRRVNLLPESEKSLDIVLQKSFGEVSVQSNVNASVTVNGVNRGSVPQSLSLQTLPQTLTFTKSGYREFTTTITPDANQVTQVNISLLTEFDARRAEGRPLFSDTLGIAMTKVQPQAFTMGSPPNEAGRQRNEHQLRVNFDYRLWVGIHEITEQQFAKYNGTNSNSTLPVTNIDWIDAAKFCNWLSEQEALTPVYSISGNRLRNIDHQADGYRLPTEAEWEWLAKKARRATETPFVWGAAERIPEQAGNFADESVKGQQLFYFEDMNDGFADKAPIGSFRADRQGLHDLAGNVSEWVQDFYSNVPPDKTRSYLNYTGPARGSQHLVKGANYTSGRLKELRNAAKTIGEGPAPEIGFRIVRRVRGGE